MFQDNRVFTDDSDKSHKIILISLDMFGLVQCLSLFSCEKCL